MPHAAYKEKKKMPPWKPNLVQVIGNVARVYAIRLATNDFFFLSLFLFFLCLFVSMDLLIFGNHILQLSFVIITASC